MSDVTINAKVPSVNVTAAPQSNVITPKIQIVGGGASITVDDALSLTSENPVQNKVITSALNEKAPIIINTASGEIASIQDGADDMPIRSLVANIEPVQDLHGYDHPWPGGGSKNKLPNNAVTSTIQGVTFTVNSDKSITVNGTSTGWTGLNLGSFTLPAGNYKLVSLVPSSNTYNCYLTLRAAGTTIANTSSSSIGAEFTLEEATEINCKLFARPNIALSNVVCYPMIILSTETDISYLPYSNICPISGWTGANIYQEAVYDESATPKLSISWESEAGTVYGGTLAINQDGSCDLTVADANIASYNGETLPSTWISDRDVYAEGTTPTIGAQVVYKLATPTVYHLPSVTMLKTLLGTNNIWADIGDVEVKYPADTKLYIDNLIASLSS